MIWYPSCLRTMLKE